MSFSDERREKNFTKNLFNGKFVSLNSIESYSILKITSTGKNYTFYYYYYD